ncbi:glycyl-radical enzyme activating protein [Pontiella agarivorans]|uniref:Glycyl-radical enzyme activating protein n=1 Tax=Pontiella agarivorans TaxID=3038953 RepID=A0ABU5N192_9BACT|nr:glycyl-radical enzyme activating protein [Pontiella agarivorans]MDZ8120202.1 glycyl-radical enzyme activating protein [Pontiella agarivorans]
MTGHTFSIKRMQTHDGPGLRTTVFMKGCPLRCAWCHNPESQSSEQEIWLDESKCIGCGFCFNETGERTHHSNWNGNLKTVKDCPSKALKQLRQTRTEEQLFIEIQRDADFFENGGVTFSGGEPLQQPVFVSALLQRCRQAGFHTAIDTCGAASDRAVAMVLPHTDLMLFDLKIMNPNLHKQWTGRDNRQTLENFRRISAYAAKHPGLKLWIRTPLIPGATDSRANIRAIARFLKEHWSEQIERWELCAFNNLATDKYRRLQKRWPFENTPLITRNHGADLLQTAIANLGPEKKACIVLKGRMT